MANDKPRKEQIILIVARIINLGMVVASYFLISNDLLIIALLVFFVSKWRVVATRPGLWFLNARNALCDISFGLSIILLMDFYHVVEPRLTVLLAGVLFVWQLLLRPLTHMTAIKLQSILGLAAGTTAIWTLYPSSVSSGVIVVGSTLVVGYAAAFHTLRQLDEDTLPSPLRDKLIAVWVYVVGLFAWLAWLWNVTYSLQVSEFRIPQISLLLTLTFYFLGSVLLYIQQNKTERTSRSFMVQQTIVYSFLVLAVAVLTEWNSSIQ